MRLYKFQKDAAKQICAALLDKRYPMPHATLAVGMGSRNTILHAVRLHNAAKKKKRK